MFLLLFLFFIVVFIVFIYYIFNYSNFPHCCCNTSHFPTVGLIKNHLSNFRWFFQFAPRNFQTMWSQSMLVCVERGRALSYTHAKQRTAQRSLLVSNRRSSLFHAQRSRCVSSKGTCAHLCAPGCVGLKMRCGQTHCWHMAILRPQKALALLTNKNLVLCQWHCIFRAI